ncbi:MAG: hypothetical protein J6D03_10640 [Clostridia bacterium]|nr:hypothetical protein [Clostridia bacterium]
MNLKNVLNEEEVKALEDIGLTVENKEYKKDELRQFEVSIEDFIMSHSSKNGDISRLINQYSDILYTLIK